MNTVTAFDAKTRFGELLDRVARGEEIVITRHDKPVARMIPEGYRSLESVRAAVEGLRTLRRETQQRKGFRPLAGIEIRRARDLGRP